MELLLYCLIIVTVTLLTIGIDSVLFTRKKCVHSRLDNVNKLFKSHEEGDELSQPFYQRLIKPMYDKFINFIGRATPKQITISIKEMISHAGTPNNMNVNRFIAIQFMLSLLLMFLGYFFMNAAADKINILLILLLGITGILLPIIVFRSTAKNRKAAIEKSLPSLLDLLFVSVEAGLGFDMALKRTIERMDGPLSDEFERVLDEINKGRKRDEALRAIVQRTGVNDLASFISAVIQSEQLGSNIANMLRIQSTSMRQKRRQRAEAMAMKVPIKMLFPLVFFMFPALFIVILGPAIMQIIATFSNM